MTLRHELARRAFLRRTAGLAMAGTALPLGLNLAAFGEAAAQQADDYKALVCVFLYGGNDQANTLINVDPERHEAYRRIRASGAAASGLALPREQLGATLLRPLVPLADGAQYALHPAMGELAGLFHAGRAAALLNVGPLIVPLTKAQYLAGDRRRFPVPPKLFSHNDQASVWQSGQAEGATTGWGGRLGDQLLSANLGSMFTCLSATGAGVFACGDAALRYQVGTQGPVRVGLLENGPLGAAAMRPTMLALLTEARDHALEQAYNRVMARSVASESVLRAALDGVPPDLPFQPGVPSDLSFPAGNPLAAELAIVARLIAARQVLGLKRQVFLVSLGGFDHHDQLMEKHPRLLAQLSQALAFFHHATEALGVASQVTAFTASEFGRTLTSNGNGTDHGWGSHHVVVGGAVRGGAFYGQAPPVSIGVSDAPQDQWHVGQGRLLPSTSVDQFAGTLARWFGVDDSALATILPNLANFGPAAGRTDTPLDLGFMR